MARSVVATDNFNRANGAIGANWTKSTVNDGLNIASNAVKSANAGSYDNAMFWNANSFANNQYSQAVITLGAGVEYEGVIVRANTTDYIIAQCREGDAPDIVIYWYNGGSYTHIASQSAYDWVTGDVLRVEAEGTTISFYVNDVLEISGSNGSIPASGSAGISMYNTTATFDDWEGGDLVDYVPRMGFVNHSNPGIV